MRRPPSELRDRWNHNTHYYADAVALAAARPGGVALDVGCGDGLLLDLLAPHCRRVVGVDAAREAARTARANASAANVDVLAGDLLAAPLRPAAFDLVVSCTAVHHVPLADGLAALAGLLRPGGGLFVLSLAHNRSPGEWIYSGLGVPVHHALRLRYGLWQHGSPVASPEHTWAQARAIAERTLPGVRWRRHLLWRYSLTWVKPAGEPA